MLDSKSFTKKNRRTAFDFLFSSKSISDELTSDKVFIFWKQLLIQRTISDPDIALPEPAFVYSFDSILLIYPEDVAGVRLIGKSATGLDGLTVFETEKINRRIRAK